MNRLGIFALAVLLAAILPARPSLADNARVISISEALHLALQNNATLRTTFLQEARAIEQVTIAEGIRPFTLQVDGGYTHSSNPALTTNDVLQYGGQDGVELGAQLQKTFAFGTSTALRVEGSWDKAKTFLSYQDDVDPSRSMFGLTARLSVTQPLLRGFGTRIGEASLRTARYSQDASAHEARLAASRLARDVQSAYWDAWYAGQALDIDRRSRDIAAAQVAETQARVDAGSVAPVDLLSFRTRLATLDETVAVAEADLARMTSALAATLGIIDQSTHVMADPAQQPPVPPADPARAEAEALASRESPEILRAEVQVTLAEDQALIAGEDLRHRLDLVGWVQAQAIGARAAPAMVPQFGNEGAYSGYVGFVWEWPLASARQVSEHTSARLSVEIAREQLRAAREGLTADVVAALQNLASARRKQELAAGTLMIAQESADAERERLRLGSTIFASLRDAEEAVREASLRAAKAQVDLAKARLELDHLTGQLLARIAPMLTP